MYLLRVIISLLSFIYYFHVFVCVEALIMILVFYMVNFLFMWCWMFGYLLVLDSWMWNCEYDLLLTIFVVLFVLVLQYFGSLHPFKNKQMHSYFQLYHLKLLIYVFLGTWFLFFVQSGFSWRWDFLNDFNLKPCLLQMTFLRPCDQK